MKIGLIGSLDFGTQTGAHTRAMRVYSLLDKQHDVTFINVNTTNKDPIPEGVTGRDLAVRPDWLPHTGRELVTGYRTVRTSKICNFDLIWAYNSFQHTPLVGYATARHLDVPLVVGINDHRHGRGLKGQLVNKYARQYILKQADTLVFESEILKQEIEISDIDSNHLFVVPTGINTEDFYAPEVPLAEEPIVFYVGRDDDIKLLLDAAEIIHKQYPTAMVRLAGVSSETYPTYADEEYIEFLGYISETDLRHELARAHVCTVPYQDADTAGRPVKILEYMSSGTCIIATNINFNTQMLSNDRNAIIANANVHAFAEGILQALDNPVQRDRLASQARIDVQEYSLKKMEKSLQEVVRFTAEQQD